MGAKDRGREVHRLLDIVVEEVSLVDRAANKHRFLIVKRGDPMDESTAVTSGAPADEPAAGTETQAGSGTDREAAGAEQSPGQEKETPTEATSPPADSPLAVAVQALEGLTEAVELLGTLGEEEARARLVDLAGELRGVSERLAALSGAPESGDGADAGRRRGRSPARATARTPGRAATPRYALAAVIESVRATLQRVGSLVEAAEGAPDGGDEDGEAAGDAAGDGGADGSESGGDGGGLAGQLAELAEALRSLTETVKEQQQRLARLEKRFGLPHSAPAEERPARTDDDEVGWPLDLNRPFDRDSVDKAVSFHDV